MRKSNGVSESAVLSDTQRKRIPFYKHVLIKLTVLVIFMLGWGFLSSAFVSTSVNGPVQVMSEVLGVSRLPASEETTVDSMASPAKESTKESVPISTEEVTGESVAPSTEESTKESVTVSTKETTGEAIIPETSYIPENSETAANESSQRLVVPFFYMGDQFGTLRIPSVDLEVNVYQGDSEDEFRLGAGHYVGSLFPGQDGNVVIASHNTTYFRDFEFLMTGDLINLETTYGLFIYQIREIKILETDFNSIVEETEKEQLTMYTCYPFNKAGGATGRYVVLCELIESDLT